jgi:hypothetical protein
VCADVAIIPLMIFVHSWGEFQKCFKVLDSTFLFDLLFFIYLLFLFLFFFPSFSPLDSVVDGSFEEG